MAIRNKELKRRILDLSYKHKLSHIASCLTAVDIIDEIYLIKKSDEKFILSNGHSGLALYCVIEKYNPQFNAEYMLEKCGIHPDRLANVYNPPAQGWFISPIDCSTGSLGQGLPIAVGMALADRSKNVYCLVSDGEITEGSIWEAIRLINDMQITNLKLYVNWNGYGAYSVSSRWAYAVLALHPWIEFRDTRDTVKEFPFLKGLRGHYQVMDEKMYKKALRRLK